MKKISANSKSNFHSRLRTDDGYNVCNHIACLWKQPDQWKQFQDRRVQNYDGNTNNVHNHWHTYDGCSDYSRKARWTWRFVKRKSALNCSLQWTSWSYEGRGHGFFEGPHLFSSTPMAVVLKVRVVLLVRTHTNNDLKTIIEWWTLVHVT